MELVEQLDDLWGVAPADFVAQRTQLVRRLKDAGDAEQAALVGKLRKPPRTVWALNVAARSDPASVRSLLEAGATVATSMRAGGDELRAAQTAYARSVDSLVDRATELTGVGGADATERMRATLLAAGAEPEGHVADALRRGTLRSDAEAPGFPIGADLGPSATEPDPQPAAEQEREREEERERERRSAEREIDRLRSLVERADRQADQAEASVVRARAEAERARSELDEATARRAALEDED